MPRLKTYRQLRAFLNEFMSESELDQPIQISPPHVTPDPIPLQPGIYIGTVAELELSPCRSSYDNKWHGEDIVILADRNPFAVDGATAYETLEGREMRDGESFNAWFKATHKPIYGRGDEGTPTDPKDQFAPGDEVYDWNDPDVYMGEDEEAEPT